MIKWLYWLPAAGWAALIFYLSTRPGGPQPSWWFPQADKVIHAILFGTLAALIYVALRRAQAWRPGRAAVAAFLAAVLYGMTDEVHQLFTPARSSDLLDVAADATGAACVFVLRRASPP